MDNTHTTKNYQYSVDGARRLLMYLALGSIIMMFAGFTSAYIVKKAQEGWSAISLPSYFYVSNIWILLSSLLLHYAGKKFHDKPLFNLLLTGVLLLGFCFIFFQWMGFQQLYQRGYFISGGNTNSSFLYVIIGLHAIHVIGGIVALFIMRIMQFLKKAISRTALSILAIYWHFVGILWVYLFLFFLFFK